MIKKISDKDKAAWQKFINSKEKIYDKDQRSLKKNILSIEKTIDLHGYTLEDANKEIEKFIANLEDLKSAIENEDGKKLEEIFIKTKKIRKEIVKAGQDVSKPDFGR